MRVDNWPAHLTEVVESYRQKEFTWGTSDCFCFAADCIKAITSFDFLADYRGLYHNEETAQGLISQFGTVRDAIEAVLAPLKPNLCPLALTQRGDLVLLEVSGRLSLGIWAGSYALAPMPGRGLTQVPKEFIRECRRIE